MTQLYICLLASGQPNSCPPWEQTEVAGVAPQCPTCGGRIALPAPADVVAAQSAVVPTEPAAEATALEPTSAPVATLDSTAVASEPTPVEPLVAPAVEPDPTEAVAPLTQETPASDGVPAATESPADGSTGEVGGEVVNPTVSPEPSDSAATSEASTTEDATVEPDAEDDFVVPGATIPEAVPEQTDEGDMSTPSE